MSAKPSKSALKQELVSLLQRDLEVLQRAHRASQEGATHEEAKPENDKDTRALEQSYLARGQARRVDDLSSALSAVQAMSLRPFRDDQPIAIGALVQVEEDDQERLFFIAPEGGGTALADGAVQVVTPRSPLGRALLGKRVGDVCSLSVASRTRELAVVGIE
mgnify:FL=1